MTSPTNYTASYPRYVEPPVQYAALEWTGSNVDDVQGFLSAHRIDATAMLAGSNVLLLLPTNGGSVTYQAGTSVILRSDADSWFLDTTRRDTTGLARFEEFYVTTP